MNRLFLIGCQRSGTTLLRLLLETHSRIYCMDEQRSYSALRDNDFDNSAGHDLVGYKIPRWTEQLNQDWLGDEGDEVICQQFYNGEPAIFMLRDVYDVVCSMMSLKIGDSNWWSVWGARILKSKIESPHFRERYCRELEIIGDVDANKFAAAGLYWKYKSACYFDYLALNWPVYGLRYEDLVTKPERSLHNLINFLKINWDENILHHYMHPHVDLFEDGRTVGNTDPMRPISDSSVGQWEKLLSPLEMESVRSVAGNMNEQISQITPRIE